MRKRIHSILCFGLTVILLVFGMNFDEADTLFYAQNTQQTGEVTEIVCTGEAAVLKAQSLETVMVGMCSENQSQRFVKQTNSQRSDTKIISYILKTNSILECNSNSDRAIFVMKSGDIYHSVAVLNYIHDLDGKKRV